MPSLSFCTFIQNTEDFGTGAVFRTLDQPAETAEGVQLYPNPAGDELNIRTSGGAGITEINIVDLTGRSVYRQTYEDESDHRQTDVSQLAEGVYLVRVHTLRGREVFSLRVQ